MNTLLEMVTRMTMEKLKLPAAVAAYVALGGVLLMGALAFGVLSPFFGGFARADRVNRIARELNAHVAQIARDDNSHWANQTATALLRMDQTRCRLPQGQLRSMYDQLIQVRQQEYYHLTGQYYPLPRCTDL
ncbi:MAG: hypothetical protein ACP5P4_15775 [Steroidobacteraceae bacterium]